MEIETDILLPIILVYIIMHAHRITLEIADLASLMVLFRTSFILSLGAADSTILSRYSMTTGIYLTYILVHIMYCEVKHSLIVGRIKSIILNV